MTNDLCKFIRISGASDSENKFFKITYKLFSKAGTLFKFCENPNFFENLKNYFCEKKNKIENNK